MGGGLKEEKLVKRGEEDEGRSYQIIRMVRKLNGYLECYKYLYEQILIRALQWGVNKSCKYL